MFSLNIKTFNNFTYTILIDAVIVYPMVIPTRLAYCATPHSVTFTPPVFTNQENVKIIV